MCRCSDVQLCGGLGQGCAGPWILGCRRVRMQACGCTGVFVRGCLGVLGYELRERKEEDGEGTGPQLFILFMIRVYWIFIRIRTSF